MLNWAKNGNSFIHYEDSDYRNGDGKLDGDKDKIVFNDCLVKCLHISYFFLFACVENIKRLKHESEENNNANYASDTKHCELFITRDIIHNFMTMKSSSLSLFFFFFYSRNSTNI
jgi:hypothetical protein